MCKIENNAECICCYCKEKRHKLKCLLKPKNPKFEVSGVCRKAIYEENGVKYIVEINKIDFTNPYEFKYSIYYSTKNNSITTLVVSESKLKEFSFINNLKAGDMVIYKPNNSKWIVKSYYIDDDLNNVVYVYNFEHEEIECTLNYNDLMTYEEYLNIEESLTQKEDNKKTSQIIPSNPCLCIGCRISSFMLKLLNG